jgi:hypothetical protein
VLALLADRELSGSVKNTRLAIRKQRDGISGFEIPFNVQIVETGTDEDGDPITAQVIDWKTPQQTAEKSDVRWTPSMQLLRRVLMATLADHGQNALPFLDEQWAAERTVIDEVVEDVTPAAHLGIEQRKKGP